MPYDAQVRRISWVSRARPARGRYVASSSPLPAGRIYERAPNRRPFSLSRMSKGRSARMPGQLRRSRLRCAPAARPRKDELAEADVAHRFRRFFHGQPLDLAAPVLAPALALGADVEREYLDIARHARPALAALLVAVGADSLGADRADD